jgi:hypothetical protein
MAWAMRSMVTPLGYGEYIMVEVEIFLGGLDEIMRNGNMITKKTLS